jgi:hypothetical protein
MSQKLKLEELSMKVLKRNGLRFIKQCEKSVLLHQAWKTPGAVLLIYRNADSFINLVTGRLESVDTLYKEARERIERAQLFDKPNSYTASRNFSSRQFGGAFQAPDTDLWISVAGEWQGESECLDVALGLLAGREIGLMGDEDCQQVIAEHSDMKSRLTIVFSHMLKVYAPEREHE